MDAAQIVIQDFMATAVAFASRVVISRTTDRVIVMLPDNVQVVTGLTNSSGMPDPIEVAPRRRYTTAFSAFSTVAIAQIH